MIFQVVNLFDKYDYKTFLAEDLGLRRSYALIFEKRRVS